MTRALTATLLAAATTALALASCQRQEKFPAIGTSVASPVDVAASADGTVFYVLNADFDRTYNHGSVLALDVDGNKLGAVEIPRMGRTLTVSGTDMLVTVDHQDDRAGPRALLFDLSADPAHPQLVKEWPLECSPYNAVMRKSPATGKTYEYFAVTCLDGPLYVGRLTDDRAASTLKMVRNYGITRRALYLDPARQLLLGFTTDPAGQKTADVIQADETGYDTNGIELPGRIPNEVPDEREKTRTAQSNRGSRQLYQFFVYDLAAEGKAQEGCIVTETDDCTLPFRKTTEIGLLDKELRWLYFKLYNFDGTPDPNSAHENPLLKYYRTNFYEAQPDPLDPDSFYLSHRGPPKDTGSPHANQIVRVTIAGDLRPDAEGKPPHTGDVMTFERVYGFKGGESTPQHYPGDFEVAEVQGQRLLLVNHFRDLVNWVRSDVYFAVAAKTLDDDTWFSELPGQVGSGADVESFYQVAMNRDGRAVTCSYYGNAVTVLQVTPGVGIEKLGRVK